MGPDEMTAPRSAQRAAEEALVASEERYRLLAESATDLVTRISVATGEVLYVSPSVETVLGWKPDELQGAHFQAIVHPDDADRSELHQVVAAAGQPHLRTLRLQRRDGSWAWCESSNRVVVDPVTRLLEVRSSLRDVSDRIAAQQALAASEERFRLTQLHAPIGLALVGLDGRWLEVNPALCELLGRSEAEMLTLTVHDVAHPDDLAGDVELTGQLLRDEIRHYQLEKRYLRADGAEVWALLSAAAVRVAGQPQHLVAQILDITDRKRDQQALEAAATSLRAVNEQLIEAGKVKDHVLAATNHELRTPLTVIVGFADLLVRGWDDHPDDQRLEFVRRILGAGRRMTKMVDDFLFAVAFDSGTIRLDTADVQLRTVLDVAVAQAGAPTGISISCQSGLSVFADADRLAQILINYLTNAVRYGAAPIRVEATEKDGFVDIRVNDHGDGVPAEFIPRLFDRFSQASQGDGRTGQGIGLGLDIARRLAWAQGGDAWYEPNQPHGATFAVRVPTCR